MNFFLFWPIWQLPVGLMQGAYLCFTKLTWPSQKFSHDSEPTQGRKAAGRKHCKVNKPPIDSWGTRWWVRYAVECHSLGEQSRDFIYNYWKMKKKQEQARRTQACPGQGACLENTWDPKLSSVTDFQAQVKQEAKATADSREVWLGVEGTFRQRTNLSGLGGDFACVFFLSPFLSFSLPSFLLSVFLVISFSLCYHLFSGSSCLNKSLSQRNRHGRPNTEWIQTHKK